jgi:serine/threonine protein kinase
MDIAAELLDDGAPLAPGTQLGPYRIEKLIGAGGMGCVYRAHDTRLNRTVAIKISKEGFGERFEREARAVAALNHPHICQLYDNLTLVS